MNHNNDIRRLQGLVASWLLGGGPTDRRTDRPSIDASSSVRVHLPVGPYARASGPAAGDISARHGEVFGISDAFKGLVRRRRRRRGIWGGCLVADRPTGEPISIHPCQLVRPHVHLCLGPSVGPYGRASGRPQLATSCRGMAQPFGISDTCKGLACHGVL